MVANQGIRYQWAKLLSTLKWVKGSIVILWEVGTLRRFWRGLQAIYTYGRARLGGKIRPVYPLFLSIEPTTACNLRCIHCVSGQRTFLRPRGTLRKTLFAKLLAELSQDIWGVQFYFQGEPFLHPELPALIKAASQVKLFTTLSTNGHFLDIEMCENIIQGGLKHLIISVDGMTPETYRVYRVEGDWEKLQQGIKNIIAAKKRHRSLFPLVELQFIVWKHNLHEKEIFLRWAYHVGADKATLKTGQLLQVDTPTALAWLPEIYRRYIQGPDGRFRLYNPLSNHCWRLWRVAEVTWDGQLVPCCFDKHAQHSWGNVSEQSFLSVWHSPKAQSFRQKVFQSRKNIDICQNCTEGTRIW
ncbi:MAG: radical SAM/SPASM domain-containing protein [Bacteroidia bacterium]